MKKILLCSSLVVLLFFIGCAKERIRLQLNLEQGSTYTMHVTMEQKMSQTVQQQQVDITQTTTMEYIYEVVDVNDMGNATVKMTFGKVGISGDGPMGKFEYKSWETSDTIPMVAKGFAILAGKSVTAEMSPQGRAINVSGTDEIVDAMLKELDVPKDDAMIKEIKQNLENQYGGLAMKETMGKMFAFYPEKAVAIGDVWRDTFDSAVGFPMITHNTWKLKKIKDGKVYIDLHSKIESNPAADIVSPMGGMKMSYDISGDQKGTMVLDETTGWCREAEFKQHFHGTINIFGEMYGQPRSMEYPIDVSETYTIETIEK